MFDIDNQQTSLLPSKNRKNIFVRHYFIMFIVNVKNTYMSDKILFETTRLSRIV